MFWRCEGDAIQADSICHVDIPPGPLRMFSATEEKVVPASTLPRFWWVSDWFCAIQFAQDCAYPLRAPLAQSPPRPAVPRSVFMASITALPPPSHTGGGGGGGGATWT